MPWKQCNNTTSSSTSHLSVPCLFPSWRTRDEQRYLLLAPIEEDLSMHDANSQEWYLLDRVPWLGRRCCTKFEGSTGRLHRHYIQKHLLIRFFLILKHSPSTCKDVGDRARLVVFFIECVYSLNPAPHHIQSDPPWFFPLTSPTNNPQEEQGLKHLCFLKSSSWNPWKCLGRAVLSPWSKAGLSGEVSIPRRRRFRWVSLSDTSNKNQTPGCIHSRIKQIFWD